MGSQSPGSMTLTTIITVTTFTSLILTVTQSEAFFLFRNKNGGAETRSTNLTQDAILGLFDTVTGLTHGIGGIFEQFEDGFARIKPTNKTIPNKVYVSDEEEDDDTSLGSTAVVGLFDSLRNLNKQVGKLVGVLGHTLTDRREDVEKIATNVDTRLTNFGHGLRDWRRKQFGVTANRKTENETEAEEDRNEVIITDYMEADREEDDMQADVEEDIELEV